MAVIYRPSGKAREYSPLALNLYRGCDHDCAYCYVKGMPYMGGAKRAQVSPRAGIIETLERELKKRAPRSQVLLSFTGDPYCVADQEFAQTRRALELLSQYRVPVAILTKGGKRCLRDLDLFKAFAKIKVGATLTFSNGRDSAQWEPGAALPEDRLDALYELSCAGIQTWASFEPVIDPAQSLEMLARALVFVDHVKVGKWNHDERAEDIDWSGFCAEALSLLRGAGKRFYIKRDLWRYFPKGALLPEEMDQDFLALGD